MVCVLVVYLVYLRLGSQGLSMRTHGLIWRRCPHPVLCSKFRSTTSRCNYCSSSLPINLPCYHRLQIHRKYEDSSFTFLDKFFHSEKARKIRKDKHQSNSSFIFAFASAFIQCVLALSGQHGTRNPYPPTFSSSGGTRTVHIECSSRGPFILWRKRLPDWLKDNPI